MAGLKLEVGKSYRRRDGEIEDIVRYDEGAPYPFVSRYDESFTESGEHCDWKESAFDLIEEVVDDPAENKPKAGQVQHQPKTEKVSPGIDQIPFEGIEAIGEQFAEGEPKYGRDNWKKDIYNIDYDRERCRHAMRHLWLWANGDRSENHLAKVGWFVVTQVWRERQR